MGKKKYKIPKTKRASLRHTYSSRMRTTLALHSALKRGLRDCTHDPHWAQLQPQPGGEPPQFSGWSHTGAMKVQLLMEKS